MLASLESASVIGIHASPVHIEVDLCFGLPRFQLVGLPDTSVKESRDRVHAAIRNSGFDFPQHRIVINMAPADVRKAGVLVRSADRARHYGGERCRPHARHPRRGHRRRTVAGRHHPSRAGGAADCRGRATQGARGAAAACR